MFPVKYFGTHRSKMYNMETFGERLALLRNEKEYSRKDLAKKLGVSVRQISYWECNQRECDFSMLIKISNLFEVSIDFLLRKTKD